MGTDAAALVRQFFERVEAGDAADATAELFAEDAVMEIPFSSPPLSPEVAPPRIEGRKAIADFWRGISETLQPGGSMRWSLLRPLEDPTWCLGEAEGAYRRLDGTPYRNRYCVVARVEGGRIAEYREYSNPLCILETFVGDVGVGEADSGSRS